MLVSCDFRDCWGEWSLLETPWTLTLWVRASQNEQPMGQSVCSLKGGGLPSLGSSFESGDIFTLNPSTPRKSQAYFVK